MTYQKAVPFARPRGAERFAGTYTGPAPNVRAGADRHAEVPSRAGSTLRYRDGRVTDLNGQPLRVAAPPSPPPPQPAPPTTPARKAARPITTPPPAPATRPAHLVRPRTPPPTKPATPDRSAITSQNARPGDFAAAIWHDGELEIFGLRVDADGYARLTAPQTAQLAMLLAARTNTAGAA